jgi:hypothetical protein
MTEDKKKTMIKSCELKTQVSRSRKCVRTFNNRMDDAELENNTSDVPCQKCFDQISREGKELKKEACRLKTFFENDQNSAYINCRCTHQSSDGDGKK